MNTRYILYGLAAATISIASASMGFISGKMADEPETTTAQVADMQECPACPDCDPYSLQPELDALSMEEQDCQRENLKLAKQLTSCEINSSRLSRNLEKARDADAGHDTETGHIENRLRICEHRLGTYEERPEVVPDMIDLLEGYSRYARQALSCEFPDRSGSSEPRDTYTEALETQLDTCQRTVGSCIRQLRLASGSSDSREATDVADAGLPLDFVSSTIYNCRRHQTREQSLDCIANTCVQYCNSLPQ